jgi:hypothetical protein
VQISGGTSRIEPIDCALRAGSMGNGTAGRPRAVDYNTGRPDIENGGNVTRPRAADDFAAIRARLEQLRLERDRALVGPKAYFGPGLDRTMASEDERQGERRLPRSAILRKLVR